MYSIYRITNKIDSKCYIGYTKNPKDRFKQHLRNARNSDKCPKLYRAIRKWGAENFSFDILCEGEDNKSGLEIAESLMIEIFNPEYNLNKGGSGVVNHSLSTKDRIRLSKLGSKNPAFGKPGTFLGKTHTEETKKIIKEKRSIQIILKDKKYGRLGSWVVVNKIKKQCPYCKRVTSLGNAKRWHFNNCKEKNNGL